MKQFVFVMMLGVAAVLAMVTGCSGPTPVSHFVVHSADGRSEFTVADSDTLRSVLDTFAAARKMSREKSGEAGVIRYYVPTEAYPISFFAARGPSYVAVYAQPMTPGVIHLDAYTQFRQSLANALTAAFPGRVTLSTK